MRANGEAIRTIRERTGYSQTALAKAANLAPSVLSRLESGQRHGTPAQLRRLADVLDVPITIITRDAAA